MYTDVQRSIFELTLQHSTEPLIWIDAEGNIFECNISAGTLFGLQKHVLTSETVFSMFHIFKRKNWKKTWNQLRLAKTLTLETDCNRLNEDAGRVYMELKYYAFDHEEFATAQIQVCYNPNHLVIQNIYRCFANDVPNCILLTFSNEMMITLAEGGGLGAIAKSREAFEGRKLSEICSKAETKKLLPYFTSALNGQHVTIEIQAFNNKWYQITTSPLYNTHNEVTGGLAFCLDIDKTKSTEIELSKKLNELAGLNHRLISENIIRKDIEKNLHAYSNELKLKNEELEQFAYVASHDLQEPLRMISSFTQLLARKYRNKLDSEADEFINYTIEGANVMQQLINDLLTYSRIDRKGNKFEKVDFEEVMHVVIKNLTVSIQETGAVIRYDNMPVVYGDKLQLIQLAQNLISNSIKFHRKNVTPEITIKIKSLKDLWLFSFTDNGIGLNMEHKDRVFNIFQRLHTREKYPGTGIGLAICKKILDRHQGEIWLESEQNLGTTFFFTLRKHA